MAPASLRGYSILTIKSFDEDQRIIAGIATTPEPDRVGDIVVSEGITAAPSIPLLLYHDARQPVGTVKLDKPTRSGVTFTAKIPKIDEPGTLRERVNEAWSSIRAGLIRGVSIGFRVLEDAIEPIKGGGLKFLKTEVVELSLVSIPANASASILSIKALDVDRSAALGTAQDVPLNPPASRDRSRVTSMNVSEQLTAKKAERKEKSDKLEKLIAKSLDAVLSDEDRKARTELTDEVASLNDEIKALEVLENSQASQAKPVVEKHAEATTRTERIVVEPVKLPPGIEFTRAVMCLMKEATSKGRLSAVDIARKQFPDHPRIQAYLKTAVDPMTTADGVNTGGTELVYATNLVSEFIDFLRPQTIVGKFGTNGIPSLRRVPFNVRITGQTSGGAGYWVGQAQPKPLKKFDFSATTLGFSKVAAISVLSDELVRFSSPAAEGLVRDALAGSLIERLDTDFVDPAKVAVANVSPASITNSVAGIATSGTDAAAVRVDIQALLAPFIAANISPSAGVFITTETVGLTLSLMMNALGQPEFPNVTMRGGSLVGFPVITSQYCAGVGSPSGDILIFCNASDIFLSDDGAIAIDASREASLEMEDSPASPTEGAVVSMYQNNLVALRAERYINWAKRRAAAAQWIVDVAYVSGSPA